MVGGGGERLYPALAPQHPLLHTPPSPQASGVPVSFCSSSMPVNSHCSSEKDRHVFSLEALFWTFSPWAKGLEWEASLGRVAPGKERLQLA
jgi:hypothetical protein